MNSCVWFIANNAVSSILLLQKLKHKQDILPLDFITLNDTCISCGFTIEHVTLTIKLDEFVFQHSTRKGPPKKGYFRKL